VHEFTLYGDRWRIDYEKRPGLWGECDFTARRITIHTQLRLRKRLEIIIHEILHAGFPDASEESVTETAKVVAGVLLADGWKRGRVKAKPMKTIKASHINGDGIEREVVKFEAGDTIPADAIEIDGEWHVPKVEKPATEDDDAGKARLPTMPKVTKGKKAKDAARVESPVQDPISPDTAAGNREKAIQ